MKALCRSAHSFSFHFFSVCFAFANCEIINNDSTTINIKETTPLMRNAKSCLSITNTFPYLSTI